MRRRMGTILLITLAVAVVAAPSPAVADVAIVVDPLRVTDATDGGAVLIGPPDGKAANTCSLDVAGRWDPDLSDYDGGGGTMSSTASLKCNFTPRATDVYVVLTHGPSRNGFYSPYPGAPTGRATCNPCFPGGPSGPAQASLYQSAWQTSYYRDRADFTIQFPPGQAYRFSPLCGPPSGDVVTCRRFSTASGYGPTLVS